MKTNCILTILSLSYLANKRSQDTHVHLVMETNMADIPVDNLWENALADDARVVNDDITEPFGLQLILNAGLSDRRRRAG